MLSLQGQTKTLKAALVPQLWAVCDGVWCLFDNHNASVQSDKPARPGVFGPLSHMKASFLFFELATDFYRTFKIIVTVLE